MSNTVTSLKDPLIAAVSDLLPMFGIDYKFMCELPENSLTSGEQINILIGLTQGIKGNILLGMTRESALRLVSGMMGGMEVPELDSMGKSALCEFMNMLAGSMLGKLNYQELIDLSPPTLAIGDKMFLMISRVPSKKVFFKMENSKFNIAYCIE